MPRTVTVRKYGKATRRPRAEELFAQLPRTPVKEEPALSPKPEVAAPAADGIDEIAEQLGAIQLDGTVAANERAVTSPPEAAQCPAEPAAVERAIALDGHSCSPSLGPKGHDIQAETGILGEEEEEEEEESTLHGGLRVLTWEDVCAAGDRIEKIAEASYAEVYRITNEHGTSIIKAVRLRSPIKPQTAAQRRAGLVDEEPHAEEDMRGELRIAEWLADIPGFVVYKERYVVRGRAPRALLETHREFHRRTKRRDPDRLQFYPSPSRYLDETRFLVVELGDAGTALEDFELTSASQLWDVFLHTALALARAEDLVEFEHRDLHEGNLCIRQARPPKATARQTFSSSGSSPSFPIRFGDSGLDITILDYGLSRATSPSLSSSPAAAEREAREKEIVAYDLERDLSLFQSTHAPQCAVYRQMRSFLLHRDRFPSLSQPRHHATAYPVSPATGEPISWRRGYHPYTNVLWLAYLYGYLVGHFRGDRRELARFRRETAELRRHLDPAAPRDVLSFPSAGEVVRFAVEAGWVAEEQLVDVWGDGGSRVLLDRED